MKPLATRFRDSGDSGYLYSCDTNGLDHYNGVVGDDMYSVDKLVDDIAWLGYSTN